MIRKSYIGIGYWQSYNENDLPSPEQFVNMHISADDRSRLISYLQRGKTYVVWRGWSYCRFRCGVPEEHLGHACLTDGTYQWPEGLAHYVQKHQLWLPETFIQHAFNHPHIPEPNPEYALEPDLSWW